jgi:hypothetical protein
MADVNQRKFLASRSAASGAQLLPSHCQQELQH